MRGQSQHFWNRNPRHGGSNGGGREWSVEGGVSEPPGIAGQGSVGGGGVVIVGGVMCVSSANVSSMAMVVLERGGREGGIRGKGKGRRGKGRRRERGRERERKRRGNKTGKQ